MIKIDWDPPPKTLRFFGAGLVIIGIVFGLLSYRRGGHYGVWAFAALALLGILITAWPKAGKPVYKAWMSVAFVIGTVISTVILAALYFCVFTPLALAFKIVGRDALKIKWDKASQWRPIKGPEGKDYFERLF